MPTRMIHMNQAAASAQQNAQDALGTAAMEENLKAVAALADSADKAQQDEHIHGIVATTLAHLSSDASAATHELAAQWKDWALSLVGGTTPAAT